MPRHTKLAAGRKDMYYQMAKETGYRSRAAFKLLQLNKKYNLLEKAKCLIDLCAAPGGWSQVAIQHMQVGSLVIAVDLDPIKPVPGLVAFQSDITSQHCRTELKRQLSSTPVDIVVHDGAPNVSGDYMLDSFNQNVLVLYALKLACEMLRQGGSFVTKIFRSGEHMQVLYVLKQLFEKVELTKPASSRQTSAEIFAVCLKFKGQFAQIDQKMFDPEIILQNKQQQLQREQQESSLKNLVKNLDHHSRHRDGYEDSLNRRVVDVVRFVTQQQPIQMLGKYHSVIFDVDFTDHRMQQLKQAIEAGGWEFNKRYITKQDQYKESLKIILENTTEDIKLLLQDVKQLNKAALQKVLMWQRRVFGIVCQKLPILEEAPAFVPQKTENDQDLVQQQQEQLDKEEIKQYREKSKSEKKKQLKMLKKFQNYDKDAVVDVQNNDDNQFLFIGNKNILKDQQFQEGQIMESSKEDSNHQDEDSNVIPDYTLTKMQKFIFSEEDQEKYHEEMDQQINLFYDQLQLRQRRISETQYLRNVAEMQARGVPRAITDRWFSQSEFQQHNKDDDEFANQFPLPKDNLQRTKRHEKRIKAMREETKRLEKENAALKNLKDEHKIQDIKIVRNQNDEEEVQRDLDSDDEISELEEVNEEDIDVQKEEKPQQSIQNMMNKQNIDGTATKMALAQCFLTKKGRQGLEESAFGKLFYQGNDDQYDLPAWFVQDELQNNQPQRPITAEEVTEMKQHLAEMQKLPKTKKEREAVARKKMHTTQKLSLAQNKIQEVINRDDLTEREKIKKLKHLHSNIEKKPKKAKVVYSNLHHDKSQPGGKLGHHIKFTDRRMKKDIRAQKAREKRYGKDTDHKKR